MSHLADKETMMKTDIKTDFLVKGVELDDTGADLDAPVRLTSAGLVGPGIDGDEIYVPLKVNGVVATYPSGMALAYSREKNEVTIVRQHCTFDPVTRKVRRAKLDMSLFTLKLKVENKK